MCLLLHLRLGDPQAANQTCLGTVSRAASRPLSPCRHRNPRRLRDLGLVLDRSRTHLQVYLHLLLHREDPSALKTTVLHSVLSDDVWPPARDDGDSVLALPLRRFPPVSSSRGASQRPRPMPLCTPQRPSERPPHVYNVPNRRASFSIRRPQM